MEMRVEKLDSEAVSTNKFDCESVLGYCEKRTHFL